MGLEARAMTCSLSKPTIVLRAGASAGTGCCEKDGSVFWRLKAKLSKSMVPGGGADELYALGSVSGPRSACSRERFRGMVGSGWELWKEEERLGEKRDGFARRMFEGGRREDPDGK